MKALLRAVRMVGALLVAALFAVVQGGCGAEFGGGRGLVDFPPNVWMERWESIAPGVCKGWLTNNGSHTARDVHVHFWYRTAKGTRRWLWGPPPAASNRTPTSRSLSRLRSPTESCASRLWGTS